MRQLHVVVSATKFSKSFLTNVGGIAVDNAVFRMLMFRSVPEIFAIEVQSCPKSHAPLILGGSK